MIYIQTDVRSLQRRTFVLFSALSEVISETQNPPPPLPTPPSCVCGAVIFPALGWKVLRKLWRRASGTRAGWWDYIMAGTCRSIFFPPSYFLARLWMATCSRAPPGDEPGGTEPSPWWSEPRTCTKQSIVTGVRWGERNKMSQQRALLFFFLLFLSRRPSGVCLAFDSSVPRSAKRAVCDIA